MENIRMRRIRQVFESKKIGNIPEAMASEFEKIKLPKKIKAHMRIGVTVGSRGIANLELIIRLIIEEIRKNKGIPFIITAMGSHGGATAEGQKELIARYGFTEESMGAPIMSSMEVVELGQLVNGLKVYFNKIAFNADGIIVVNRIKVHTAFKSAIESGLCKMLSVGLGNHKGASLVHSLGVRGLRDYMVEAADVILKKVPVLCGIGILENAYDETYRILAGGPEDFKKIDVELLRECKRILPTLPVQDVDILFVGEIGKNISGTGMDTNIVGGIKGYEEGEYTPPNIKRIIVQDLTDESKGNALGVGIADLITKKVYDKIDWKSTYTNTIAATFLDRAKIPMVVDSDREALEIALKTIWNLPGETARVMIIRNTLKLDELYVSEPIWEEIRDRPTIEPIGGWQQLQFGDDGELRLTV